MAPSPLKGPRPPTVGNSPSLAYVSVDLGRWFFIASSSVSSLL